MTHPIVIDGLSVSYDKKRVLSNVYLRLEEGKLIGVLGPNGAGKSTLFKAILGLIGSNAGCMRSYQKVPLLCCASQPSQRNVWTRENSGLTLGASGSMRSM